MTLAEDGAQASSVLERPDSPKLVLLDWVLPDIEGIDLCQKIREAESIGKRILELHDELVRARETLAA